MGSRRVGHDSSDLAVAVSHTLPGEHACKTVAIFYPRIFLSHKWLQLVPLRVFICLDKIKSLTNIYPMSNRLCKLKCFK